MSLGEVTDGGWGGLTDDGGGLTGGGWEVTDGGWGGVNRRRGCLTGGS